ncbi:MAG: saccharopine dehydrogenase NADP-binding domain-containing protein, partial [Actinomycetota bacterium]|nr:saccharopine dehydrogenase NADP-binding domain-containing protein [Actinomycetota bacterium]
MSAHIVLFGATGFTGDLVARALVARGAAPLLVARDERRVAALAAELGGLDHAVADVERPETLRAVLRRGDVLVSTVGPFARLGGAAVEAAIARGAHYLDSTGEAPFIRDVFARHGPMAEGAGCTLVPAFGFDFVPGNLAGALALRGTGGRASRVEVGYFLTGATGGRATSGGTRASAAGLLLERSHAWRDGRLVLEPAGRGRLTFRVGGLE